MAMNIDQTSARLANIRGSTLDMMTALVKFAYQLPPNFDNKNPYLRNIVALEAQIANTRNTAKDTPAAIQENLQAIQNNMEQINQKAAQRNPVAQQALAEFNQILTPLREQVNDVERNRHQLTTEINQHIKNQEKIFRSLIENIANKNDIGNVKSSFNELNNNQSEFQTRIKKIQDDEKKVVQDLVKLRQESTVRAATLAPGAVTPEQLTQLKK